MWLFYEVNKRILVNAENSAWQTVSIQYMVVIINIIR